MTTGKRMGAGTKNSRIFRNWQVRRGLMAAGMAAVLVAAMAFLVAIAPSAAQACLLAGIPC